MGTGALFPTSQGGKTENGAAVPVFRGAHAGPLNASTGGGFGTNYAVNTWLTKPYYEKPELTFGKDIDVGADASGGFQFTYFPLNAR
jgi:hypothetical protein